MVHTMSGRCEQAPIGTAGGQRRFRSVRLPHGAFEGNLRPQCSTPDGWGRLLPAESNSPRRRSVRQLDKGLLAASCRVSSRLRALPFPPLKAILFGLRLAQIRLT